MILYPLVATLAMLAPELTNTQKSDLKITLGSVSQTRSGYLTVVGPKERAQRKAGTHQDATLQFRYRGPSKQTSKLASGELVRQIGLKLRAKNSCNLLYVMWRIEPVEQIVVTFKSNPGASSHSDCGAHGYSTIANIPLEEVGTTAKTHTAHRLRARVEEEHGNFRCIVDVDDKTVWSGPLETRVVAPINGPVGFRSDNGSFIFKLFVAEQSR
ncbi:hypothetical protein [Rhodopirellula europaea]|uniref:hypothetical protein n=1 Tax=Rhodopirellula europaea TaxID=1263866 RepID=UPI003D2DEF7A|tara:strand:- start:10357 stop:10995 length:639 start_codon:yes stop_codon:yes gene_type:complete